MKLYPSLTKKKLMYVEIFLTAFLTAKCSLTSFIFCNIQSNCVGICSFLHKMFILEQIFMFNGTNIECIALYSVIIYNL